MEDLLRYAVDTQTFSTLINGNFIYLDRQISFIKWQKIIAMSFCRDLVGLVNRCYAVYSFLSSNSTNPQQKPWHKLTKTNMPKSFRLRVNKFGKSV